MGRFTDILLVVDEDEAEASIATVIAWLNANTAQAYLVPMVGADGSTSGWPFGLRRSYAGFAKNIDLKSFSEMVSKVGWEDPDSVFLVLQDEQQDRPKEWRNGAPHDRPEPPYQPTYLDLPVGMVEMSSYEAFPHPRTGALTKTGKRISHTVAIDGFNSDTHRGVTFRLSDALTAAELELRCKAKFADFSGQQS